ncbi:hypothetical protein [Mucilaginibacter gossypiicola]|nr:hypothetical protein [Mucilaginibacter gossypiicola]
MRSKEDILNSYNTTGADGLPEISAEDLLNAMEAYKQEWAEAAFAAARQQDASGNFTFNNYAEFIADIERDTKPMDGFGITLAAVADSIVTNFLPDDDSVTEFDFDFTMQGKGYTAFYTKDTQGYWKMSRWAEQF